MQQAGQVARELTQLTPLRQPSLPTSGRPAIPDELPAHRFDWIDSGIADGTLCPCCCMEPGQGYVRAGDFPVGHPQFGQLVPCPACSSGNLSAYLKKASRLTGELTRAAFNGYIDTFERRPQLEAAQALVKAGHGWLTIWGSYGQSKSYLLACVVNAALTLRRPAVYTTAADLLDHLRSAYHPDGPGFSEAFDYWRRARVLAVDEVTEYNPTPWAAEKLRQLLGYRYDRRDELVTVFASEVEPGGDDWPGSLGWLASRMKQSEIVQAAGGDVRPLLRGR